MNRLSNVDVSRPPRITTAIGYSISWPGISPEIASGTSASPVASAVIMIGASRSWAPAQHQPDAEGFTLLALEVLVVVDQHDAVARRDARGW